MQHGTGLGRLFAVSFATDLELYLILTAVPFKALRLGADPLVLGGLAAASTGTYAVLATLFGRLGDRMSRTSVARASCAGLILACIGLTLAPSLRYLLLCIPFVGGSLALFWPNVQASIADRSTLSSLQRNLGRFNLCWSLGKASGFLLGGILVTSRGPGDTFMVASCLAFVGFFLLPPPPGTPPGPVDALLRRLAGGAPDPETGRVAGADAPGAGTTDAVGPPPHAPARAPGDPALAAVAAVDAPVPGAFGTPPDSQELDARAPLFRRMAWCANSTAYGLAATLNHHYPRLVKEHGWSPRTFGLFLGLVYVTQTLAFVLLMLRPELWRFRRSRLYVPQCVMLVAIVSLPLAGLERVLVSALLFGIGLGICYYSSIYYSLHTHTGRGRNAGVHEGLIGLGSMAVPLLGGVLARQFEVLWMPYIVAAAALGLSIVAQETLYRAGTAASRRQTAGPTAAGSGLDTPARQPGSS